MYIATPLRSLAVTMRVPLASRRPSKILPAYTCVRLLRPQGRTLSSTKAQRAKSQGRPQGPPAALQKRESGPRDRRIRRILYHLTHPRLPPPLRFSRLRALRHWTIHRAAQLLLHNARAARQRELEQQYQGIRNAMEELRVGLGDGGRLYRQAMDRKGVYGGLMMENNPSVVGNGGVPIEYARAQTEGPPRKGWDENWVKA